MFDKLMSLLFLVLFAIGLIAVVLGLAILLGMSNAWAAPHSGTAYSHEVATDNHPVIDRGFKSFVVSREADGRFIISGEKLGGEAVRISVLVMDDALNGQYRSDEGVERQGVLTPIGATTCHTDSCSVIEFAAGEAGRFELTVVPATWLVDPSYTVSVDEPGTGNSMNIHEPEVDASTS